MNKNTKKQRLHSLQLSKFVHKYNISNSICLYHSLLIKKIFLSRVEDKVLTRFLKEKKVEDNSLINKLYKEGFLIQNRKEDELLYQKAQEIIRAWGLKTLFLVITDKCNFKCKYCFENLKKYSKQKDMDEKTAKKAIDVFAKESDPKSPKTIFFYGGEPLLNFRVIKSAVQYAAKLKKEGKLKEPCNFDIITNGSLINQGVVDLAKKYGIGFGVSLDGFKHNHDKMRIFNENIGTYETVVRGIKLLRENNIDISILCTVGPHNINELDKICEFFICKLGVKNINLTLPLCKIGKGYPFSKEIPIDYLLKQIIKASKVIRKYGAYEGTFFKHLISFVEEEIFRGECDGMGCQVVVSPDGKIGPCLAFINEKGFFIESDFSSFDIKKKSIFKKFAKGIALAMPECKYCPALGICGGGCIFNRFVKEGKIGKQDKYFCEFMKKLLKYFITELKK